MARTQCVRYAAKWRCYEVFNAVVLLGMQQEITRIGCPEGNIMQPEAGTACRPRSLHALPKAKFKALAKTNPHVFHKPELGINLAVFGQVN